jgi:hypothetical protein
MPYPLSQIEKEYEVYVDPVNFCRFSHNMRKICHEIITQSLPL